MNTIRFTCNPGATISKWWKIHYENYRTFVLRDGKDDH